MLGENLLLMPTSGGYPAMTMTSASYDTTTPIVGAASLSGGTGTATVVLPNGTNTLTIDGYFRLPSSSTSIAGGVLASITDQSGYTHTVDWVGGTTMQLDLHYTGNGNDIHSYTSAFAAGVHYFAFELAWDSANIWHLWVDGTKQIDALGSQWNPTAGNATFNIGVPASCALDSIRVSTGARYAVGASTITPPTGPLTRDANTLGLWQLDGNGQGS